MDANTNNSLYEQVFLNKTVQYPANPAFLLGTSENANARLADHVPTLQSALRLDETEFALLSEKLELDQAGVPLNLLNLSALYRYTLITKTLKLNIKELLALLALSGESPFLASDPNATIKFIETVKKIKNSGFTISQLEYVYRNRLTLIPLFHSMAMLF